MLRLYKSRVPQGDNKENRYRGQEEEAGDEEEEEEERTVKIGEP